MSSAIETFASIPELVGCLARVSINREVLRNCCSVNKLFQVAFTPFLYSEIWFRASNAHCLTDGLLTLLNNEALKYTKTLDLAIPEEPYTGTGTLPGVLCERYNHGVQTLLAKMPQLERFRYVPSMVNKSLANSWKRSWENIILYTSTMTTLSRSCPSLHSLTIHHPDEIQNVISEEFDFNDGYHERKDLFNRHDLSGFSKLTDVEIFNIHSDLMNVRAALVQVLLGSPNIRALSLSINSGTMEEHRSENTWDNELGYEGYLEFLCLDYAKAGGKPLQLQKLVLGLGIVLWEPVDHLEKLTDLTYLEDVYIVNRNSGFGTHYIDEDDGVAWSLFTPTHCPNLSSFGFYAFTKSVTKWFESQGSGYITRFSTVRASEEEINKIVSTTKHGQSTSSAKLKSLTFDADEVGGMWHLNHFPAINVQDIQALSVVASYNTPERQAMFILWIKRAVNLEQMFIPRSDTWGSPAYVHEDKLSEDSFEHKIAVACKNLRYLKLEQHAWCILRERGDNEVFQIRIEKLDRFEWRTIEAYQPTIEFNHPLIL